MRVDFDGGLCVVTREATDKKMRAPGWGRGCNGHAPDELSTLLYHLMRHLNGWGFDLIKKRIDKDGHLFGHATQQYLRARGPRSRAPHIFIYHERYAVEDGLERYNKEGLLKLAVAYDVFGKQPNCEERVRTMYRHLDNLPYIAH